MNKKFSTLVASLLLAGAWTTANAEVKLVDKPVVGGSYLLVTAVDADNGKATDLVEELNGAAQAVVKEFGSEWTLVAAKSNKEGAFYLKNKDGKYILVDLNKGSKAVFVDDKAEASIYYYDEVKEQILSVANNYILVLNATGTSGAMSR